MPYAFSGDLTHLDAIANAAYPLGFKAAIPAAGRAKATEYQTADVGDSEFVYVYNDSGVTIAAGDLVARKAATVSYRARTAPVNAPVASLLGVALQAIPTGYCGFVQCKGYVATGVNSTNADLRDAGLYTGAAAGRVYAAAGAATDAERGPLGLGLVDNSAGAAGALCAAYVSCPMA
jgi:hypothetical protein